MKISLSLQARFLAPALVASVALLAAGCGGGGGGGAAKLDSSDVATVGSLHIPKTRFEDQLSLARASLKSQKRPFPKVGTTEYESIKAQAMALLVQTAARELKAEDLGITVSDADVEKRLKDIKKQYFAGSEKRYQAQLKQQGLTESEVRAQVKTQILSEQVADKITKDVTVSDADVHKYYVDNKAQYVQRVRDVLEILVGKNKEKLAKQIHDQVAGGADFGKLAKQYSQDPGSKNIGGKFTATQGKDVANFDQAVFSDSLKTGQLAAPVNTPEYGWFVIKATGDIKTKTQTEKEVADTIRQQLLQEKKNEVMTNWLTDVAKNVCTGDKIKYQVGYTPNPDPCAAYTSTTSTDTTSTTP
jgi:parvulin-like peptidyl-prolyl isomerase